MLELKQITKQYVTGDSTVQALKGIDLKFRENEFVSVLGPSGCGKTTLLNIIGGLDQYTSGDLIINGTSTKKFKNRDWDTYRNHTIGFVFQSYNLISHQTVLSNVELALTLSGVSREERHRRAIEALEKVGLGDQLKKKPNQMSGGQMQRVAIARALVNNPDILLADEPTGALDSTTSLQIMELLKEVAKDRLVIMVTHNPELAEQYSTRIIRLKDGTVTGDTNPCTDASTEIASVSRRKKTSMSFFTALSLSRNNLMTKKGRTFMIAFAGSIGICFSAALKRSTISTVVTYGTLVAVVAGTYFINRFALSVSGMDLQRSAAYVLGESSAKASSGGFFYLFLLNPAVTFMAVIGGQAGRGTPLADIVSYFGIPENGFIIKHWIGFSILIQLAAGMALINRAIHFVEPIKHKKTSRKGKK